MIVGLLEINIHLNGVGSLKQKRSIVKSLIERLKNRFNVSAAETDSNDSKLQAVIGIATVANESRFVNQRLDKIIEFVRNDPRFSTGVIDREVFGGI